ncbi:unnamed protein product [Penicillium nalgiovense]|uniref:Rab-GAP TBC domain-containing protein n=1 Tax=Penicillium nalgiovense TaxID=60175 RepID=A0A1V6Z6A6_PENNA|nr:hypothetical protein PENNAL_c0003G03176 [Penicillium nalgiovense]CAG7949904.1 unnamed protein product [Penicillium nalgiovense]CAG8030177.1 unnamed protein product [Penicillium nalgiovense]CAG8052144.1 unnamed protein product [Penicillium nalgiovense]CAG8056802.1 unnamed protein product [Penicillium nalgiovense]
MVNEVSASLSPDRSEFDPTIHAVPFEKTDIPLATRSVSLPTADAPIASNGRPSSTSAASASPSDDHASALTFPRLAPSMSVGDETRTIRSEGPPSLRSMPSIVVNEPGSRPSSRPGSRPGSRWSERKWGGLKKRSLDMERKFSSEDPPPVPQIERPFTGIPLDIPTASLDGLDRPMKFSNRGSLIKSQAHRPHPKPPQEKLDEHPEHQPDPPQQSVEQKEACQELDHPVQEISKEHCDQYLDQQASEIAPPPAIIMTRPEGENGTPKAIPRHVKPQGRLRPRQTSLPSRAISADEDMLSRRVRLMYEKGEDNVTDSEVAKAMASENGVLWEEGVVPDTETSETLAQTNETGNETKPRASAEVERMRIKRETQELAGGAEYWQNVGAEEVDRYGFIRPAKNANGSDINPLQRVTTSLLLASEAPRRKRSIRPPTAPASNRSFNGPSLVRKISQSSLNARPSSSQSNYGPPLRRSTSRLRTATNHLPHNRDRKAKDEAADMLTLPTQSGDETEDAPVTRAMRRKEWQREDKWTKMAKPTKKAKDGGGMTFEFDTQSSKLIERTWKGIPDRWRSTAWYSFLEASARRHKGSPPADELIEAFNELQFISSPDDVQIDIDVPRTISSHIMFRRRYRGGQRLLFRVLHAMSLYFPETGYVQGMATLAATLLAYYDEEHAFIMLVRLWQLRGLEELYKSGFAGLMEALADFEREWLAGGEVATKLNEVGIPPTAYGTRWYLTLFNYSIPFPAQLRVWDVFMLLGDAEDHTARPATSGGKNKSPPPENPRTFGQGLDVLHASSAALIDGMREIILESDFENIMKVLTSWVPIKDTEMFMRVAKAEWKVHRRRKTD